MTKDQFITEKILKECWHEWEYHREPAHGYWGADSVYICKKCGEHYYGRGTYIPPPPNFSDWPDKGRLIDFCMGQDDYLHFQKWAWKRFAEAQRLDGFDSHFFKYLLDNFATLVAEYRGWKP